MYHRPHVLDVMVQHVCRVQVETLFIQWIIMSLQMKFQRHRFAPLVQLPNGLRHIDTNRYFMYRELLSASPNAPLNGSEVSRWHMLILTRVFHIEVQFCRRLVRRNDHRLMNSCHSDCLYVTFIDLFFA